MFSNSSTSLKYYKRLGIYKNSTGTCQYNPTTGEAYSYNWRFVAPVKGVVLFNWYKWSNTTSVHQSCIGSLLRDLKIKTIKGDFGRSDVTSISIRDLYRDLFETQVEFEMTRDNTWKKGSLASSLKDIQSNIDSLIEIGFKLSIKKQIELREEIFNKAYEEFNETQFLRACKYLDKTIATTNLEDPTI